MISSLLVILLTVLSLQMVLAAEPSGAIVNATGIGKYPGLAPGSVSVESGNITLANVNSTLSTYKWSGLAGNISGSIVLGDGSSNIMFSWSGSRGLLVYAARSAPTWASLTDANQSNVVGNFSFLSGSADNYTTTFTGAIENIGSNIFTTITSDYAQTRSTGATVWKTYSLGAIGTIVFAAYAVEDGTSYRGDTVDYQMIIPENGTAGDLNPTSWNLYVELN